MVISRESAAQSKPQTNPDAAAAPGLNCGKVNDVTGMRTTGSVKEYGLPTYNSGPVGIADGPNGDGLRFAEQNTNRIGFITTAGAISEFSLTPSASQPRGIALGSDGNLWFTQSLASTPTAMTGYLGRITPSGSVTEFAISNAYSRPFLITSGPDNNLWFTDEGTDSIGRITLTGAVAEFPLPPDSGSRRSSAGRTAPSAPSRPRSLSD